MNGTNNNIVATTVNLLISSFRFFPSLIFRMERIKVNIINEFPFFPFKKHVFGHQDPAVALAKAKDLPICNHIIG